MHVKEGRVNPRKGKARKHDEKSLGGGKMKAGGETKEKTWEKNQG